MGNSKPKGKSNNAVKGHQQNKRKLLNNGNWNYKSNKSNLPNTNQWRRKKPQDEVRICTVVKISLLL